MIEFVIEPITQYIMDEIGHEEYYFDLAVKWYFKITTSVSLLGSEEMREYFLKFREIRNVYKNGKSFVNNMTKGKEKGFSFRWYQVVENSLKVGRIKEANEFVKRHLEFVKKWKCERTYYRHLKKVRALGIKI